MINKDYDILYKFHSVVVVFKTAKAFKKYAVPLSDINAKMCGVKEYVKNFEAYTLPIEYYKELVKYIKHLDIDPDIVELLNGIGKYKSCKCMIISSDMKYVFHELSHSLFKNNKSYRNGMESINDYFEMEYKKDFNAVAKKLLQRNYYLFQVSDEIAAYLATTSEDSLLEYFNVVIPKKILMMYRGFLKSYVKFNYRLI